MIRLRTTCLLFALLPLIIPSATVVAQDAPPPLPPVLTPPPAAADEGRPWLGLVGDDMGRSAGVRIVELRPQGPAVEAGLQVGDLLTGAAGLELKTLQDMLNLMQQVKPGQQIELNVVRDGRRRNVMLQVATRPSPPPDAPTPNAPTPLEPADPQPYLGVRMIAPDDGDGALVERVEAESPAHLGGLRPGQRIVSMDGQPINRPEDMAQAMANVQPGQEISFGVIAANQRRVITVTVGTAAPRTPPPRNPTPPPYNPNDPFGPKPTNEPAQTPTNGAAAIRARIQQLEKELEDLRAQLRRIDGDQ